MAASPLSTHPVADRSKPPDVPLPPAGLVGGRFGEFRDSGRRWHPLLTGHQALAFARLTTVRGPSSWAVMSSAVSSWRQSRWNSTGSVTRRSRPHPPRPSAAPASRSPRSRAVASSGIGDAGIATATGHSPAAPRPASLAARTSTRFGRRLGASPRTLRRLRFDPLIHTNIDDHRRAVSTAHEVVRGVPTLPFAVMPVQPERLRSDPHHFGIEVHQ